jgi:hypothetical protein
VLPLSSDRDATEGEKLSKLRPLMKILRSCCKKFGGGLKSQETEFLRDVLLSALVLHTGESASCLRQTHEFLRNLLSAAVTWTQIARDCTLDIFKGDPDFQPKVFESTHPYADNRTPPPSPPLALADSLLDSFL